MADAGFMSLVHSSRFDFDAVASGLGVSTSAEDCRLRYARLTGAGDASTSSPDSPLKPTAAASSVSASLTVAELLAEADERSEMHRRKVDAVFQRVGESLGALTLSEGSEGAPLSKEDLTIMRKFTQAQAARGAAAEAAAKAKAARRAGGAGGAGGEAETKTKEGGTKDAAQAALEVRRSILLVEKGEHERASKVCGRGGGARCVARRMKGAVLCALHCTWEDSLAGHPCRAAVP